MKFPEVLTVLPRVDMSLALSLANAAVGKTPPPRITFHMVRLSQHLARIVRIGGGSISLAPLYAAAIMQDGRAFTALFHALLAQAEAVITEEP